MGFGKSSDLELTPSWRYKIIRILNNLWLSNRRCLELFPFYIFMYFNLVNRDNLLKILQIYYNSLMKHRSSQSLHRLNAECEVSCDLLGFHQLRTSKQLSKCSALAWSVVLISYQWHRLKWKRILCALFIPLPPQRRTLYLNPQSVPRCKHFSSLQ